MTPHCAHCGRQFHAKTARAVYCSGRCRQAASVARIDARWREHFRELARAAQDQDAGEVAEMPDKR